MWKRSRNFPKEAIEKKQQQQQKTDGEKNEKIHHDKMK